MSVREFDVKEASGNVNGLLSVVQTMDWGVVLSEWQGSCEVFLVGQSHESAGDLLREAAGAVAADGALDLDRRALELAKAEHARMGPAMRACLPGHDNVIVTAWDKMAPERRNVMVAVWRSLLDDGVVT